jgi:hypothetical protein
MSQIILVVNCTEGLEYSRTPKDKLERRNMSSGNFEVAGTELLFEMFDFPRARR